MSTYIAFLRGINVGGRKIIPMERLTSIFNGLGFKQVKTVIQSGNVIFKSGKKDREKLGTAIENGLEEALGYQVEVMLRSLSELEEMVNRNPFAGVDSAEDIKLYVCFFRTTPLSIPGVPLVIEKEGLELIEITNGEAYMISRPIRDRYGFPNNYIEKQLAVPSTARNWNTLVKVMEIAKEMQ